MIGPDPTTASSQPGDPTDVAWVHGNDRLAQIMSRPGMQEAVAGRRAQMQDADRTHAMGLAALRQAAALTQNEIARQLGITQAAVAKTEQRHDMLLSTLSAYLETLGGQARMIVTFHGGGEIEVDLPALRRDNARGTSPARTNHDS